MKGMLFVGAPSLTLPRSLPSCHPILQSGWWLWWLCLHGLYDPVIRYEVCHDVVSPLSDRLLCGAQFVWQTVGDTVDLGATSATSNGTISLRDKVYYLLQTVDNPYSGSQIWYRYAMSVAMSLSFNGVLRCRSNAASTQ
jgi:hypothetical protein